MSNINGQKYGLTTLFPIKADGHSAELRRTLRGLDAHAFGSPLSEVGIIHMARFAIIDGLPYQGIPAKRDVLRSRYLLFMCDFDGADVATLVGEMIPVIAPVVDDIWRHCVAYPGPINLKSVDEFKKALTAYFRKCQLETNLLLADRRDDEVDTILRALACQRAFTQFVEQVQRTPVTQKAFGSFWASMLSGSAPHPGSL